MTEVAGRPKPWRAEREETITYFHGVEDVKAAAFLHHIIATEQDWNVFKRTVSTQVEEARRTNPDLELGTIRTQVLHGVVSQYTKEFADVLGFLGDEAGVGNSEARMPVESDAGAENRENHIREFLNEYPDVFTLETEEGRKYRRALYWMVGGPYSMQYLKQRLDEVRGRNRYSPSDALKYTFGLLAQQKITRELFPDFLGPEEQLVDWQAEVSAVFKQHDENNLPGPLPVFNLSTPWGRNNRYALVKMMRTQQAWEEFKEQAENKYFLPAGDVYQDILLSDDSVAQDAIKQTLVEMFEEKYNRDLAGVDKEIYNYPEDLYSWLEAQMNRTSTTNKPCVEPGCSEPGMANFRG